jgi:hypothetical protein
MIESAYNSGTIYAKGDVATFANVRYASLVDQNKGNQPDASAIFWGRAGSAAGSVPGVGVNTFETAAGPIPSGFANPAAQGTYTNPSATRNPDGTFTSGTVTPGAVSADGTPHIWGTLGKRVEALEQFRANFDKQFAAFYASFVPPGK